MANLRFRNPAADRNVHDVRVPGRAWSLARVDILRVSVILIWGMNFAVMKSMYVYFDPYAFACSRFLLAAATLLVILKLVGLLMSVEIADLPRIAGLGLLANTTWWRYFRNR